MAVVRKKDFQLPPNEFSPGYFWFLNDRLDIRRLLSQLRDMHRHGARSVCLHPLPKDFRPVTLPTSMSPDYLTPGFFRIIRRVVAECEKLGMNYWLYDEGGWPSGGACGQVMRIAPERYARCWLTGDPANPTRDIEPYRPEVAAPNPNLLHPEVTPQFIRLTHERYLEAVGEHFGKTIRFTFTDEPTMPSARLGERIAWTDDFPAYFRRKKGYPVEECFPALLGPVETSDPKLLRKRIDYYDVRSELYLDRYLRPIRRWCRKNGLLSGGHFSGEDEPIYNLTGGFGHILRSLRALDVPGIDVIWRQLFPETGKNLPFPKYASSVAHQAGTNVVMAEVFGVYGNGLTPAEMRWVADFLLVRGVTSFVFGVFPYSTEGPRMSEERPHFGTMNPLWKYQTEFHQYLERSCYLLAQGKPGISTAFLFDIRSIWCGGETANQAVAAHLDMSQRLLERQCDFDYIDDDQLAAAKIDGATLKIGKMTYDTLVLPPSDWITEPARQQAAAFQAAGGRIVGEDDLDTVAPVATIEPACPGLRACRRDLGKQSVYFFCNETTTPVTATITLREQDNVVLCSPTDGKFYAVPAVDGRFTWIFLGGSSALFLTNAKADAELPSETTPFLTLAEGWTLRPPLQIHAEKSDYEMIALTTPAQPTNLGDWRQQLGDDFSGDALYATEFHSPTAGPAVIDLGDVRYAASIRLNGRKPQAKFMPPFRFEVELKRGQNRLEVTVSNTLANCLSTPTVAERFQVIIPKCPYEERQRRFEKDSLESGLLGPVTVRRIK